MPNIPTIVLLVETSRGYGRGLLRGVIRWRQLHGPCHLVVSTGHFSKRIPKTVADNCAGIIATVTSSSFCKTLESLGVPTIITEPSFERIAESCRSLRAGWIEADHRGIVSMACAYFLKNQFRNLAFCGIPNGYWSKKRENEFVRYLDEKSIVHHVYPCPYKPQKEHRWEEDTAHVIQWLRQLPRPVAILACNDDRGRHLLQICNREGFAVPNAIAVLGVDNDDLECELTQPPLSSIALNVAPTGYNAMGALMQMIEKKPPNPPIIYDIPLHVVERHSTSIVETGDIYVTKALRFIRNNFLYPIQVADVVEHIGISRRSLERRFTEHLGQTIMGAIRDRRFERAQQLLLHTNDPVAKIAIASGFDYLQPMLRVFQDEVKCTPNEYRKRYQVLAVETKANEWECF